MRSRRSNRRLPPTPQLILEGDCLVAPRLHTDRICNRRSSPLSRLLTLRISRHRPMVHLLVRPLFGMRIRCRMITFRLLTPHLLLQLARGLVGQRSII